MKQFFLLQTTRLFPGFEQLSSSICRRVMASYGHGCNAPRVSVCGSEVFTQFWFLSHNFGSRYARKPIKGSKDSDENLDSEKTW